MKKSTKIWLIIAASLVVLGLTIFLAVLAKCNWGFEKLITAKYETSIHEIAEDFNDISINSDTADITFVLSDDEKCKIECYETKKLKYIPTANNDTLTIETINHKRWYDYIEISFDSPKITIFLPKTKYSTLSINQSTGNILLPKDFKFSSANITTSTGDVTFLASTSKPTQIKTNTGNINIKFATAKALSLTTSTGDITLSNLTCENDINIKVSTGEINLTDIKCNNLISNASTGNISLNNVIAQEKFTIETGTGNVKFNRSDAKEIFTKTDTGDVKGSLLTNKVFLTSTDTGDIDLPKTIDGGKCEIITDTGDIKITINKE